MKAILISLIAVAVLLGIVVYVVIFYQSGNYVVAPSSTSTNANPSNLLILPTSTASSTNSSGASTAASSTAADTSSSDGNRSTDFTSPPVSWKEGSAMLSINGASLSGTKLTFKLSVAMGASSGCIPMNIRLLASDDSGSLIPPDTRQFTFPESQGCEGAPGATYAQEPVTFTVDPSAPLWLFTTGGVSNVFFQVSPAGTNGLDVSLPSNNG